jgi:hypothetical protein
MKTLPVIAILYLAVMMVFPSNLPRVHAVLSNGNNYWSAFGPNVDNLLYKVYNDFTGMFADFTSGQLDYTDWPVQPGDLSSFISNPDFFVLTKQPGGGIFQLDFNHMDSLFGHVTAGTGVDVWQTARATGTPALVSISTVACGAACPANTFQLIIQLQNLEEANAAIKDASNLVSATISGISSPTATKGDDGGPAPTGTYTIGLLPVVSGIPSYSFSTSIYSGSAILYPSTAGTPNCLNQQTCTYAFRVNYNSGSTVKPSSSGIDMARAISHLLNKPQFLTGPYFTPPGGQPLATCDDAYASPAENLIAGGAGACDPGSSVPASVLSAECSDPNIAALGACAPFSLYNLKSNTVAGASSCAAGTVGLSCFPSQSATPPPSGYPSNVDLAAACIYLLEAGFTTTGAGAGTIAQQCSDVAAGTGHVVNPSGSCNTTTAVGCIVFYIRTHLTRKAFGTIIADGLNYLFGTPAPGGGTVCYGGPPSFPCSLTPVYFTISQVGDIVFGVTPVADWNLYTAGHSTGNYIDVVYSFFYSPFASNLCDPRAVVNTFPSNYPIWCDPAFDTQVNAGEFVPGVALPAFQQAVILGPTRGMAIPVYSGANYYVGLNSWSQQQSAPGTGASIVGSKSQGLQAGGSKGLSFDAGFPSLINARPTPGYVPSSNVYCASGPQTSLLAGQPCAPTTPTTLRRGLSQTTLRLSPYTFQTIWEQEFLDQIYDTMLAVDPNTGGACQTQPGGTAHCIDWLTTSHSARANTPALGQTTWTWNLRQDIFFHDGVPVTAHDVCFSILSDKDAPSYPFYAAVFNVLSCTAVSNRIAQVVVNGTSLFAELNLGGLYIVPEHIWAPICGGLQIGNDRCVTPSALVSPSVDHVAAGDMIGSGPWVCNPSQGVSTITGQASCTQNANNSPGGQALAAGARILLQRNLGYMRCCSNVQAPATPWLGGSNHGTNLQALEWADAFKVGKVTISDVALAASVFGQIGSSSTTAAYFAHPFYSANPSTGAVDIGDIAVVAFYFDHGLTSPFLGTQTTPFNPGAPAGLSQYDPNTDPYVRPVPGVANCAAMYLVTSAMSTQVFEIQSGCSVPSLWTASATSVSSTGSFVSSTGARSSLARIVMGYNAALPVPATYRVSVFYNGILVFSFVVYL